jgi:hypothetical protein
MKKEYNTPSMIITSFENEGVIMTSGIGITASTSAQTTAQFGNLDFGDWNH